MILAADWAVAGENIIAVDAFIHLACAIEMISMAPVFGKHCGSLALAIRCCADDFAVAAFRGACEDAVDQFAAAFTVD